MSVKQGDHYIRGEWVHEAPNGFAEIINPSDGSLLGQAPHGSTTLAEQAIYAAREAFEASDWACDPQLRSRVLLEFANVLESRQAQISELLASENGKVLAQARHEVAAGFGEARYYAGVTRNVHGRTYEAGPGKMSLMTREPAGLVSAIVPWNAPVTLLVRSVAPALAAGCTVVIKPAPQTPLTNAAIMACFDEVAALPKGVVNSVNDYQTEVGTVLSSHPDIDVISFTGSSRTGKIIMANAAETVKRVSLELGGKAPAVIFDDADIDTALTEIKRGALALNGQMCTCISRILVQDSVYEATRQQLVKAFENTRIGSALSAEVELGPLVDRRNQDRIVGLIERAADEATLILAGNRGGEALAAGCFVTPSIFEIEDTAHDLIQQELFGPIVSLERFSDEQQALQKANATRFGLAASVYTRELNRGMRMSRKLKFGTVWLNCHNRLFAEVETGGYRESGVGRLHGLEAMNDFLETKHVYYETS